jgi:hypothetical protein
VATVTVDLPGVASKADGWRDIECDAATVLVALDSAIVAESQLRSCV